MDIALCFARLVEAIAHLARLVALEHKAIDSIGQPAKAVKDFFQMQQNEGTRPDTLS